MKGAVGVLRAKRRAVSALETARRVDLIVGLMQRDEWRSERAETLAAEWKCSPDTVQHLAAEASRRVVYLAQLVADPERLQADVTSVLMRSLHAAHDERARGDVARIGDIVTRIAGARAPEQHKVDLRVEAFEQLEPEAMRAKLLEQRAKIDQALAKLDAEHPEPKQLIDVRTDPFCPRDATPEEIERWNALLAKGDPPCR